MPHHEVSHRAAPGADDELTLGTPEELATHLRVMATRLSRRLRREAGIGLSPTLLSALTVIGARGPITLGQLAELEGLAPPSITKIIGKLEGRDLVVRAADPDDRRVRRVEVTAAGDALLTEYRSRRTEWLATRFADFSEDDLDAVRVVCGLIEQVLLEPTDDRTT